MNLTTATARPLIRIVALLIICVLPSVATAQVPQFDCFYVFGDSLADNGNILIQTTKMGLEPPAPPSATPHRTYFDGRFSNGPVGVEYLWHRLNGQPLVPFLESPTGCAINFAFGGTGTPSEDQTPGGFSSPGLIGQVALFQSTLGGKKPSTRALYVVSTGANDYRDDPFNVPMKQGDVVRNIELAITTLYETGARHVLVVDVLDFGKIPAYGADPKTASKVSTLHNARLQGTLGRLRARYPDLHLIQVKLDPLFKQLEKIAMNTEVPLIEVFAPYSGMSACLFINPASCLDMHEFLFDFNLDFAFLFWDVVHPTTEAHRHLAEYMYELLVKEYK